LLALLEQRTEARKLVLASARLAIPWGVGAMIASTGNGSAAGTKAVLAVAILLPQLLAGCLAVASVEF